MALFRLIGGKHTQDGTKYRKGDTIESDVDMVKKHPNKFEAVFVQEVPTQKKIQAPAPIPVPETQKAAKKEKEAVENIRPLKVPAPMPIPEPVKNDVTKQFPVATELDLRVIRKGKMKFNIVEASDPETPLNAKALTKTEVNRMLEKFAEE